MLPGLRRSLSHGVSEGSLSDSSNARTREAKSEGLTEVDILLDSSLRCTYLQAAAPPDCGLRSSAVAGMRGAGVPGGSGTA